MRPYRLLYLCCIVAAPPLHPCCLPSPSGERGCAPRILDHRLPARLGIVPRASSAARPKPTWRGSGEQQPTSAEYDGHGSCSGEQRRGATHLIESWVAHCVVSHGEGLLAPCHARHHRHRPSLAARHSSRRQQHRPFGHGHQATRQGQSCAGCACARIWALGRRKTLEIRAGR